MVILLSPEEMTEDGKLQGLELADTIARTLVVLHAISKDTDEECQSSEAVFGADALACRVAAAISQGMAPFTDWCGCIADHGVGADESKRHADAARCALEGLHDTSWANMHSRDTELSIRSWREAFAACCLMRSVLIVHGSAPLAKASNLQDDTAKAVKLLDLALIVAGPDARSTETIRSVVESLAARSALCEEDVDGVGAQSVSPPQKKRGRFHSQPMACIDRLDRVCASPPHIRHPVTEVPRGKALSLERFLVEYLAVHTPVVIRGACEAWPAISKWAASAFWHDGALGRRYVPVEMDYWLERGFQLTSLRDFVEHCFAAEASDISAPGLSGGGYMAQHALLEQFPQLEPDIATPDFALCGPEGQMLRHMFFGPRGTVTPLHYDPYENMFCQVVGCKHIRLYSPAEASRMYPRAAGDALRNNSTIQPEDILEGEAAGVYGGQTGSFPAFVEAKYVEVVLCPGDMLYLPRGWWHFVKSLSTSISVAFHFN